MLDSLDLFRNSGQLAAMTAGIEHARGDHFIFMDSDLQLDPEELPKLVKEFNKGYDIVSGCRKTRHDPMLRILSSKIANLVVKKVSSHKVTDLGCTFKIYDAKLVRAFNYGPHHVFSNVDLIGQAQRCMEVPITHYPRRHGRSGWTFRKLWRYNMDNVVRLSERPFQFVAVACVFASFLFLIRVLAGFFSDFKVFDEVFLLTAGGPGTATEVISMYINRVFFLQFRMGYGAFLSLITILLIAIFIVAYNNLVRARGNA